MLKTKIIASSVSNLTDARYFAAWGVEAMGFDLAEVSPAQVHAFKDWISGPEVIGQFASAEGQEAIENAALALDVDIIQLDVFAPSSWSFTKPIIREVFIEDVSGLEGTFILKSKNPSFSLSKHTNKLEDLCAQATCYLDISIDLDEYPLVIEEIKPEGLILRGGDEEKVGFKSYDELDEIMEALEL